jgi:hypothetical protein
MGFATPLILALFTALAFAKNNVINIPHNGLNVVANAGTTITWTDPSSGTVTIKLQQAPGITADTGYVLACMLHFPDFLLSAGI